MSPPFEISSLAIQLLADIERLLGRYEGLRHPRPAPQLRRSLRVKTVQGSVAIEGNSLAEDQITALIEGKRVVGPPREILEVKNVLAAYQHLTDWRPERRTDLLKAHGKLMAGLLDDAGQWRRGAVGVVQGPDVIHVAPPADRVPFLVQDILLFLQSDKQTHPIVKAAVMHYELEFIHPFEDGNGRIGRLWHTLVLSRYHPVFEYVPIESVIRDRQVEYYAVLGQCDRAGNSTLFIEFSLTATRDALAATLNQLAPAPVTAADRLTTAQQHFGTQSFSRKDYLTLLQGLSTATASRDLKQAADEGRLQRTGDKSRTRYQFRVG
ncbi:MAG: Fic family protein [Planctomycetes bacterium]|nr:Fic family protein [Planctomycetota bacterium]